MQREKEAVGSHDDEAEAAGGARPQEPLLAAKLRRGLSLAKRGGPCTPICPWKLEEDVGEAGPSRADDGAGTSTVANQHGARVRQHHRHQVLFPSSAGAGAPASARELGANLWEIQEPPRYRMSRRSARARRHRDEKLVDLSDLSPPGHHREVGALGHAITPASSLDQKVRSGYSRKMSTELLKVLNRIWSLEEQHTSTVSLVKTLKLELEHAQARIEELLQEKQSSHHEIDSLIKHITEDKLARKSKEQERINVTVQSLRAELEDERRLRRHSETRHRRLVKELSEIKSAFSNMMKDLEKEEEAHSLLEDLCDEFAKVIREYEEEMRELKWKSEKGSGHRCNSLISAFSETWLYERRQIKLAQAQGDPSAKNRILDRLKCEIGAFLRARRSYSLDDDVLVQKDIMKDRCLRRHSIESIHLNGAVSAPQYAEDEDSIASDLHCFELNTSTNATERHGSLKNSGVQYVEKLEEERNSNAPNRSKGSSERFKNKGYSTSQMKFNGRAQSCSNVKMQFMNKVRGIHRHNVSEGRRDANLNIDVVPLQRLEEAEAQEVAPDMKVKLDGGQLLQHVNDNSLVESESGESCKYHSEGDHSEDSSEDLRQHVSFTVGRDDAPGNRHALSSPVQQWRYHHMPPDRQTSDCSKLPQGTKESTLKTKLLEARLEGQHARSRTSKDSSVHM